jgi:signal transduction histidine kinase
MAQKAAHDIKNPLSAITLTLQRLQMLNQEQTNQTSEKLDLYVTRIIERVESLRRISKNFMKFVNIESLNVVNSDLNRFLTETINTIRAGLPPDIQLHLKSGNDLPMVKIDQDAIRSVVENLVSNAINALPEGGMITVSTQFLQGLAFPGNGQCAKDYILIEVADTGIGIAAADRDHLFEPDFSGTEGGNGLGLAYVKKTVDDHNGYIEVESEPGAGAVFSIYIPAI